MAKLIIRNNGFTLAEAMLALVIFMIAVTGLLLPFASSAAVQQQGCNQTLAARLAADLMEQVIATDYSLIVSTYGSYAESKGHIKSAAGADLTDSIYAPFNRTASCVYVYMPQQVNYGSPNFIRITVGVYQDNTKLAEIVRLKSK
ncbi:MAG: prepilin-type N-terminal cleavage/methylation domain-containing protein [Phycisphaerae bacterium]|jgi:type II secretory pathway pseudopilin PulG